MSDLNGVVGYARRWIELHRENKFQREAAKIMQRVVDALDSVRAERDAAVAALEQVRAAVSGHPECDRYEEGDVISCGWKSAYASVVAALDGAPEPEVLPVEGESKP